MKDTNPSITLSHVDTKLLPEFGDTLREWIDLMNKYATAWQWEDVPWWYNERASISLLAGAAWRTNGIALEEYSTEKAWSEPGEVETATNYRGRCDLYLNLGGHEFSAEAKQIELDMAAEKNNSIYRVETLLAAALLEAEANRPRGAGGWHLVSSRLY